MLTLVNNLLERLTRITRAASRVIAWSLGIFLLVTIALITIEVFMRKLFGMSFRFVHEYSGYMLAVFTSWGLAHTLFEKAHIRIDIGYTKSPAFIKRIMDMLSILSLTVMTLLITYYAYPVFNRSLTNGSLSNTALSTPMWIPHLLWVLGYFWFSFVTILLTVRAFFAIFVKDNAAFERYFVPESAEEIEY